jgi:hypothetical protein
LKRLRPSADPRPGALPIISSATDHLPSATRNTISVCRAGAAGKSRTARCRRPRRVRAGEPRSTV